MVQTLTKNQETDLASKIQRLHGDGEGHSSQASGNVPPHGHFFLGSGRGPGRVGGTAWRGVQWTRYAARNSPRLPKKLPL